MPSQHQIERFTLAFHEVAVERMRKMPALKQRAVEVLDRWETTGASPNSQQYRDLWRSLLRGDISVLRQSICTPTEKAATLRSMSPLGFVLTNDERLRIRNEVMHS